MFPQWKCVWDIFSLGVAQCLEMSAHFQWGVVFERGRQLLFASLTDPVISLLPSPLIYRPAMGVEETCR